MLSTSAPDRSLSTTWTGFVRALDVSGESRVLRVKQLDQKHCGLNLKRWILRIAITPAQGIDEALALLFPVARRVLRKAFDQGGENYGGYVVVDIFRMRVDGCESSEKWLPSFIEECIS